MRSSTLRDILKDVRTRPPQKLNSLQISDIYTKCTSAECLDDLLASQFFHTVVWRFFHVDVTNSHLELILQIATYEYEVLNQNTCFNSILSETEKLSDLILRILKVTMTHRKQETRLQASVFLFLGVLLVALPSALLEHPLFPKWKTLMFPSYVCVLKTLPECPGVSMLFLHCFLHFCMACVALLSGDCKGIIRESWLPFHFMDERFDFVTQRLASMVWLQIRPEDFSFFTLLNAIRKLELQGKIPLVEFAPLRLDVPVEKLLENLLTLSKDELVDLAKEFGCHIQESPIFLSSIISDLSLNIGTSYLKLTEPNFFTEKDVFDLFEKSELVPFSPDPTFPSFMPISSSWPIQMRARNVFQYLKQANSRAINVLERLTITDPTIEKGIKGSSKYFSEIRSKIVSGSKAELVLKNEQLNKSLRSGDYVLLLDIQKPNRHGGVSRMVKFGLHECVLTQVHTNLEAVKVDWESNRMEESFNALILLPSPGKHIQDLFDDDFHSKSFLNSWNEKKIKSPMFSLDCISKEQLEFLGGQELKKKRKVDSLSAHNETSYILGECEISLSTPKTSIMPDDLAEAILSMFSQRCVMIQNAKGSAVNNLVNAFLRNIFTNFPDETCLVVMPTESAIDLFHIDEAISTHCYKISASNVNVDEKIQMTFRNLKKAENLAEFLGLSDYDFLSSISNALMLYHSHVEPKWKQFLKYYTEETVSSYPFARIEDSEQEGAIEKVVKDYASIRSTFAQLESNLPLEKFDLRNLTASQYHEIGNFFARRCNFLFITDAALTSVKRDFDNVILHDLASIPFIKSKFKRVVLLGDSTIDWSIQVSLRSSESRNEIAQLSGRIGKEAYLPFNPGFRFCLQHVKTKNAKGHLNVAEAKYCVYLYQYMRILGYPWFKILIAVKSEQMKCLIEEILMEQLMRKQDLPCDEPNLFSLGWPIIQSVNKCYASDYLIVSCYGKPSLREFQDLAALSKMGLYLVGHEVEFFSKIVSGDLEIAVEETYSTEKREQRSFNTIYNVEQMGEYVNGLLLKKQK